MLIAAFVIVDVVLIDLSEHSRNASLGQDRAHSLFGVDAALADCVEDEFSQPRFCVRVERSRRSVNVESARQLSGRIASDFVPKRFPITLLFDNDPTAYRNVFDISVVVIELRLATRFEETFQSMIRVHPSGDTRG